MTDEIQRVRIQNKEEHEIEMRESLAYYKRHKRELIMQGKAKILSLKNELAIIRNSLANIRKQNPKDEIYTYDQWVRKVRKDAKDSNMEVIENEDSKLIQ